MPSKPLVFISHRSSDQPIARVLQELIETHFLGHIEVFVSSDQKSIEAGKDWHDSIEAALRRASLMILLYGPETVHSHWVHWEAGMAAGLGIDIIPVCHSGATYNDLLAHLHTRQGTTATDTAGMQRLIKRIADSNQMTPPNIDFDALQKQMLQAQHTIDRNSLDFIPTSTEVQGGLLKKLIDASQQSIVSVGVHFEFCVSDCRDQYLKALQRGVHITFAAVLPGAPAVDAMAKVYGMPAEELEAECSAAHIKYKSFFAEYQKLKDHTPSSTLGQLSFLFFQLTPRYRAYSFDPERSCGTLLMTPYLHAKRSSQSPTYRMGSRHPLAQTYREDMQALLAQSQPAEWMERLAASPAAR
ncbi:MAG: TIR domain-containing protein [Candidatus Melainabacteria bacterium]|nr:TIR domain-containing protein [Candidatus Melainabacteria bacterium]